MKLFNLLFIAFVLPIFTVCSLAQSNQYLASYEEDTITETRAEELLKKRDLGESANELAKKNSDSTDDLLLKLSIFGRAGHRLRVQKTLKEISKIYPSSADKNRILKVLRRAVNYNDLVAAKIVYEQIVVDGDDYAGYFIDSWKLSGNIQDIEDWLKIRSQSSGKWWDLWANLKKSRGTAGEVVELLAQQVRNNPSDFDAVNKYLNFVSQVTYTQVGTSSVRFEQDVSWLADVVKTDTAYESYQLATILKETYPPIGIKLLEKSISLPFTRNDAKLFGERAFRYTQIPPIVKNPEKQLRFWAKNELADLYLKTKQPQFAQPIAEELTTMDTSDIQAESPFARAGAVQASSGQRVIESKILQDEAANENSPEYWMNRASYYSGRNEPELVFQTYINALEKFPYVPNDKDASFPRVRIIYNFRMFTNRDFEERAVAVLRNEFIKAQAANDYRYLFYLLTTTVYTFNGLQDEFLVNTDLLPKIMDAVRDWSYFENGLIGDVIESKKWDVKKRDIVWNQLSEVAHKNFKTRVFGLADLMSSQNENRKAIPLFKECLAIAPKEPYNSSDYDQSLNFDYDDVEEGLFDSYLGIGDWKTAEKIFSKGSRYLGNQIGRVAVVAAKQGDISDAVRLWKININFERRGLRYLEDLARTGAKIPLRKFYQKLKRTDPLTDAVEPALKILN